MYEAVHENQVLRRWRCPMKSLFKTRAPSPNDDDAGQVARPSVKDLERSALPPTTRFRFRATAADGTIVKGSERADSEIVVRAELLKRGLTPITVHRRADLSTMEIGKSKVKREIVVYFSRQLAVFIEAGIPLVDALEMAEQTARTKAFEGIVHDVTEGVRAGRALSAVLAEHPQAFPQVYVGLVAQAEATGHLDQAFNQLADYMERDTKLMRNITTTLIGPTIVLVVSIAVAIFGDIYAIPKLKMFFVEVRTPLPLATRVFMSAATDLRLAALPIGLVAVAVVVGYVVAKRLPAGRALLHRAALKIPTVGAMVRIAVLERTVRVLAATLEAGVSEPMALRIAAEVAQNTVYRDALRRLAAEVEAGTALSDAMTQTGLFPHTLRQLTVSGEKTGQLDRQMDVAATFFTFELETKLARMRETFAPAMELMIGAFALLVVYALGGALYGAYAGLRPHG